MKNKILSMMLCAALIFTMLATPQIQPPAHAEAVALTATVIAVAVTLIVAAGVTWTSVAMGKQCTTQFLTDKPEAKQIIQDIVAAMPQTGVLVLTKTMLPKVKQFMQMVGEYFKGKTAVSVSNPDLKVVGNIKYTTLGLDFFCDFNSVAKYCPYNIDDHDLSGNPLTFVKNGVTYYIGVQEPFLWWHYSNETNSHIFTYNDPAYPSAQNLMTTVGGAYKYISRKFGFRQVIIDGVNYLYPMIAITYLNSAGDIKQFYNVPDNLMSYSKIAFSGAGITDYYDPLPVDTINIGNIDDVNEAIAHSVGQAAEGVKVDIQKLIEEIEAAKEDALPWTVEGVRELIGIRDELAEIAREQERIKDAIKEGTKEDDMSVPQLPTTITEKFPFCVPFDLIALAKTFSAEPVAPKVTIPVVFESMHYSHDFVFDFSSDNWDKVAAVIRWGTLIFFILGLTLVTRKLIKG